MDLAESLVYTGGGKTSGIRRSALQLLGRSGYYKMHENTVNIRNPLSG